MQKTETYVGVNEPRNSQFPTLSTPGMRSTTLCLTSPIIPHYKSCERVSTKYTINRDGFLTINNANRAEKSSPNDPSTHLFRPQIA